MKTERPTIEFAAWQAAAKDRYVSRDDIRFVCPVCSHTASVAEYKAAGAPEGAIGFSCIGRYVGAVRDAFGGKGKGPCNYAGGGLFAINPVAVVFPDGSRLDVFDFAERPLSEKVCV